MMCLMKLSLNSFSSGVSGKPPSTFPCSSPVLYCAAELLIFWIMNLNGGSFQTFRQDWTANGFHNKSLEEEEYPGWNASELFCVAPSSSHHFTAFFTFRLKLNLFCALGIKPEMFSVGVFLKFCSDGLMAFMLIITGSKMQKINQECYPRVPGSNWQFLAHKLLPPPPCLLIHSLVSGHPSLLSSSTSLYLTGFYSQKDAGFSACCASWQIPIHQDELWIGQRQELKPRQQDTNVLHGLTDLMLLFQLLNFYSPRKIKRYFFLL